MAATGPAVLALALNSETAAEEMGETSEKSFTYSIEGESIVGALYMSGAKTVRR